jgi:nitroimidazol reductase NimA-like FMN-containing flavoprotein (pyridoxamine 5'-phosphate oxidase superfamily)
MRSNPKVCVEVSEIIGQFHWTTIIVLGRYEEISDAPGDADARKRASELFQKRPEWWLPGTSKRSFGTPHETPVIYRVRIESITGRRAFRERV